MLRTFSIAGITAIALAAAPQAQARSNFDNFLLGATAITILGLAANQSKARPAPVMNSYTPPIRHHYNRGTTTTHKHIIIKKNNKTVYKDIYTTRVNKPKQCLRKRWTNAGWVTYYGQRCLANHQARPDYRFNER